MNNEQHVHTENLIERKDDGTVWFHPDITLDQLKVCFTNLMKCYNEVQKIRKEYKEIVDAMMNKYRDEH